MNTSVNINQKIKALQNQACFSRFTKGEFEALAGLLTEIHIPKGKVIVQQGDPVDSVYLIINGSADVRVHIHENGSQETESVATLTAGLAIGLNEFGFYSLTGKRTATVIALTDMVLLRLQLTEFHGFSLAYHHVNEVMRQSAQEFLKLNLE
jgi:CRP-like cAMP-binding protein